jgi:hypothetical protein
VHYGQIYKNQLPSEKEIYDSNNCISRAMRYAPLLRIYFMDADKRGERITSAMKSLFWTIE